MARKKAADNKRPTAVRSEKPASRKEQKFFDVSFFHAWCKQCGLCIAFCPKKIITADRNGNPEILNADRCTGCRFCEIHCPDFAITVENRVPRRRKSDD